MSGLPDFNRPAFDLAARKLRGAGFAVLSPAELPEPGPAPEWVDWMRAALRLLLDADAVALLPGWRESRGAVIESDLARALDLPRLPVPGWLTAAGQNKYRGRLLGPDYDLTVLDEVGGRE
jgi:hypothetical protein